jgi:hypothetical protein
LKRAVRSFTIETRQTKRRLKSGSGSTGLFEAAPVPTALSEQPHRVAEALFKAGAAIPSAAIIAPSATTGRILPSLIDAATLTAPSKSRVSGRDAKPRSVAKPRGRAPRSDDEGGAAQTGDRKRGPENENVTAVSPHRAPIRASEFVEPPLAVAATLSTEPRATTRAGARKAAAPKPKKLTPLPVERHEDMDVVRLASASRSAIAATESMSVPSSPSEPSSSNRKGRILGRYVFGNELKPGENWKRRLHARRQRHS